ncbi:hypothetical protein EON66_00340 [archaeon]|nr:MAG: hypothetical protein EON66_00340 [archaeon]
MLLHLLAAAPAQGVPERLAFPPHATVLTPSCVVLEPAGDDVLSTTLTDSHLEACTSAGRGGGLYVATSVISASSLDIAACRAMGAGGGVFLAGSGFIDFADNSTIQRCHTNTSGGAMFISEPSARSLAVHPSTLLLDNTAAEYAPDIGTAAVNIVDAPDWYNASVPALLWPGKPMADTIFAARVVDAFGNGVASDSLTACQLRAAYAELLDESLPLVGEGEFASRGGIIRVAGTGVRGLPNRAVTLRMRCFLATTQSYVELLRSAHLANLVVQSSHAIDDTFRYLDFGVPLPALHLRLYDFSSGLPMQNLEMDDTMCTFSIVVLETSAYIQLVAERLRGPFNASGHLVFPSITPQLATEHASQPAQIIVSCTFAGAQLPHFVINTTYDRVQLVWVQQPPAMVLPSAPAPVSVIGGSGLHARLLFTASNRTRAFDNTTSCAVSILDTRLGTDEFVAGLLYGQPTQVQTKEGHVRFENVGVAATFNATVRVGISCVRVEGGEVLSIVASLRIAEVEVAWVAPPPRFMLAFSSFSTTVSLRDGGIGAVEAAAGSILCTINVKRENALDDTAQLVGDAAAFSTPINATGHAHFTLSLRPGVTDSVETSAAEANTPARRCALQISCLVGEQYATSTVQEVHLVTLAAAFTRAPVRVVLPSSSTLQDVMHPSPALTVFSSLGVPVSMAGMRCAAGVAYMDALREPTALAAQLLGSSSAGIPYTGRLAQAYTLPSSSLLWHWNASARVPSWLSTLQSPYVHMTAQSNLTLGGSFAPACADCAHNDSTALLAHELVLENTIVQAALGAHLEMCVTCTRFDTEMALPVCARLRMVDEHAVVRVPPPEQSMPSAMFNVSIDLVDMFDGSLLQSDSGTSCALTVVGVRDVNTTSNDYQSDRASLLAAQVTGGSATSEQGVIFMPALSLRARSNSFTKLQLRCARGEVPIPAVTLSDRTPAEFEVRLLPCSPGFVTSAQGFGCDQCNSGSYTDGKGELACIGCPQLLANCASGRLQLLPGYFITPQSITYANATTREIFISDALEVHPCFNSEACEFDVQRRTFQCAVGYTGALCGVCDADDDYMRLGEKCVGCPNKGTNVFIMFLLSFALVFVLVYLVLLRKANTADTTSIIMRIALTYIQALGSLGIYKARGTETFRRAMGLAESVGASLFALGPVSCLLRPSFYFQFAVMLTLPFLAAVSGAILRAIYIAARYRDLTKLRLYLHNRGYISPAVMVLYAFYPMMVTQCFRVLDCRVEAINGVHYLKSDLSVACGTPTHTLATVIAVSMLVLFGGGIPLGAFFLLRRNRMQLAEQDVFEKYGFLYNGYDLSRGMYWWESTVLVRKAVIVMMGSTISDPYYAILAATLSTFVAVTAHLWFRPYKSHLFNNLEASSLIALCLTQIMCILYLRSQVLAETSGQSSGVPNVGAPVNAGDILLTFVLLVLNFGVLSAIGWFWIRAIAQRHHAKVATVRRRAVKYAPWCAPFCNRFCTPSAAESTGVDEAAANEKLETVCVSNGVSDYGGASIINPLAPRHEWQRGNPLSSLSMNALSVARPAGGSEGRTQRAKRHSTVASLVVPDARNSDMHGRHHSILPSEGCHADTLVSTPAVVAPDASGGAELQVPFGPSLSREAPTAAQGAARPVQTASHLVSTAVRYGPITVGSVGELSGRGPHSRQARSHAMQQGRPVRQPAVLARRLEHNPSSVTADRENRRASAMFAMRAILHVDVEHGGNERRDDGGAAGGQGSVAEGTAVPDSDPTTCASACETPTATTSLLADSEDTSTDV